MRIINHKQDVLSSITLDNRVFWQKSSSFFLTETHHYASLHTGKVAAQRVWGSPRQIG